MTPASYKDGQLAKGPNGAREIYRGGQWHRLAETDTEFQQVKALSDGRMPFPGGFAIARPYWQQMLAKASLLDPSFDAANYASRAATRKDFTSGKSAQNVTSFNTAIGHLGTLRTAAENLHNTPLPLMNMGLNLVAEATGSGKVRDVNVAKQAVADELTRAFRGTGGSLHEIDEWKKNFDASSSPEQFHHAIRQGVELLRSRIDAIGEQYSRGMGRSSDPVKLLSTKAQQTLAQLESETTPVQGQPHGDLSRVSSADLRRLAGVQ